MKDMSFLKCKKRRNRLTGKFSYEMRNAVVRSPGKTDWRIKIPFLIARRAGFFVGMRLYADVVNGTLVVNKRPPHEWAKRRRTNRKD